MERQKQNLVVGGMGGGSPPLFLMQTSLAKVSEAPHPRNKQFPSCFEPHYESEAKCKVCIMKISFHSNEKHCT